MKLTEVCIDAKRTLGNKLWVVDVIPAYEYKDGRRTENIQGYRYALVKSGKIRCVHVGRSIRIPRKALEQFLELTQ